MFAHTQGLKQWISGCKSWHKLAGWALAIGLLLGGIPVASSAAALTISTEGPKTAREGDLIEYRFSVTNEGASAVSGVEVLVNLSGRTDFVDATALPGGTYDALTGTWTPARLGTLENNRTATLTLQVLVQPGLLSGPDDVVPLINEASIISPHSSVDEMAKIYTRVVCGICNDWQMVSVTVHERTELDEDDHEIEVRYVFKVLVANNGPDRSNATVAATHFKKMSGRGHVSLKPELPVEVKLDPGESQLVKFRTTWKELGHVHSFSWAFEVRDLSLHDPIDSNTVSGVYQVKTSDDSSSGGCTLNTAGRMDPVWLLMVLLPIMHPLWRQLRK